MIKKAIKFCGIVIGSLISLILLIGIIVIGLSYILSAKIEVENPLYPPNSTWTYSAEFYDASNNLTLKDTLKLQTIDQRFMLTQNKIKWILERNNTFSEETTGFIENEKLIWFHPPRFKDYFEFTEYSVFPEIRKPITKDLSWDSNLTLGTYANQESGKHLTMKYKITSIDSLSNNPIVINAKIKGEGESGLGVYQCEMNFQSDKGFTKLSYMKANNEKLIIKLIDNKNEPVAKNK